MVTVLFPVLACVLTYLGIAWSAVWLWPAIVVAAAWVVYVTSSPLAFGKRADGSIAPLAYVVWAPLFAYQWVVLVLGRRITNEPIASEVSPGLWVGRRPRARDLPPGTALVIDLCAEFPVAPGVRQTGTYLSIPTLDTRAPTPAQIRVAVDAALAASGPVFVHCAHGHGRSATVAAAVLVRRGMATLDDVEAQLKLQRSRIGLNVHQRAALAAATRN